MLVAARVTNIRLLGPPSTIPAPRRDLHSSNPFVVGLALTALGNIGGAEIARDLAADVDKHLQHSNPYIRKKAALTTIRMLRKVPDLVDQFLPRIVVL